MKDFSDIHKGCFIAIKRLFKFSNEDPYKLGIVTSVGIAHTIETKKKDLYLFLNGDEKDQNNYPEIIDERTEYVVLMTADEIKQRLS